MNSDFTQPQRQSLVGVVVMFTDTFQKFSRALWPMLIGLAFKINEIKLWTVLVGVLVFLAVVLTFAYLRYLNFTFYIDEESEEFIIKDGVLNKSRLAIPLDKIQQVNINQSLLQRIIDVHSLEVDTAGTSKQEVSIKAIPQALATSLKARLMERSRSERIESAGEVHEVHAETDKPFIKVSLFSLFKTGITSNYARSLGLLVAFVITTFQHIEDFFQAAGYDDDPLDDYINAEMALRFLTFIIIGVMALVLVINLSRTIIKYFGYKITRQQGTLLLSYGLINTKNTILRPNKVQYLTLGRNFFQKKLNIQDLKIRQASGHEATDARKKTAIEIPGLSIDEKDTLLKLLLGTVPEKGAMLKPNFRKMLVPTFFGLVVPLCVYFGVSFTVGPEALNFINFVPVYVLFVGALIYFAFRHCRLYISEDYIIKQSGAWDIDTDYLEPHKIQSVALTQYFWQKSADVGMVTLYTAGGQISFGLANYTKLKHYANYWLYQVEAENKEWM